MNLMRRHQIQARLAGWQTGLSGRRWAAVPHKWVWGSILLIYGPISKKMIPLNSANFSTCDRLQLANLGGENLLTVWGSFPDGALAPQRVVTLETHIFVTYIFLELLGSLIVGGSRPQKGKCTTSLQLIGVICVLFSCSMYAVCDAPEGHPPKCWNLHFFDLCSPYKKRSGIFCLRASNVRWNTLFSAEIAGRLEAEVVEKSGESWTDIKKARLGRMVAP